MPVGRADTWHRQVTPQWKEHRGLLPTAEVAFNEPRLDWSQPTFERSDASSPHVRCDRCASLIPPQFLGDVKSKVLLITAGMPGAGKTTWLKCLLSPPSKKYLVTEPTDLINREPYFFVEPYTITNPDPRTAVPILLHGVTLTFQRRKLDIGGVDVKGEVFVQRTAGDKYLKVLSILQNLRSLSLSEFLLMFVVPFDATASRVNIGQVMSQLLHAPGSRGTWQGVIWTHLDQARLVDAEQLHAFLGRSPAAIELAQRIGGGAEDVVDRRFVTAVAEIERLVQDERSWEGRLGILESLTWLLYRMMLAYSAVPYRFRMGKAEFYFTFQSGLGEKLVQQIMRLAATLFAAWDRTGRGDFAAIIYEAMKSGRDFQFPVLPCGIETVSPAPADGDEGLPVWGDLLLLEILRRHV